MPTCPSEAAESTLREGRANLRNASVTFSQFCTKLLWDDINNIYIIRRIWLNRSKCHFYRLKGQNCAPFLKKNCQ